MAIGLSIGIGIPSGALTFNQGGSVGTTPFITTWRTTTSNETITIPTTGTGYNYDISTSDGRTFTEVTGNQTITFATAGDYDVSISGDFPRIYINSGVDKTKLIDIKQWGDIIWSSFERAFFGCSNLIGSFTDAPNLTNVTNFERIFQDCSSFNQPIGNWDVSNVTNINYMFVRSPFNQPLNNWDVSSVVNMVGVFFQASSFNQDISDWDVSNVTNMSYMFYNAFDFNQPLNNWNVSNVTTMLGMLRNSEFDHPLDSWNVSNVTNMVEMFRDSPFDHPINSWDVSSVTSMVRMFRNSPFDHPLNNWDVSNVTNMDEMFNRSSFDHPLNNWDVSNVTNMYAMFYLANSFNQDISDWDITSVTDFRFFATSRTFSTTNYDAILIDWETTLQVAYPNGSGYLPSITIDFGTSQYTGGGTAATARASLISNFGWGITDGGIA